MNKKLFSILVICNLFILILIYIGLVYYQIGVNVKSETWVEPMYEIKDKKASQIGDESKIIIISGSNSLFGINSKIISEITNKPVLNLAVHAGLDIDYLYYKIKKYIKPNDIVIMPLEYEYYTLNAYSDWFVNNILVWGYDYFYDLNIFDKLKFIFSVNVNRLFLGLKSKFNNDIYSTEYNVYENLINLINNQGIKWRGYNYGSSNLDGEINVYEPNIFKYEIGDYNISNLNLSKHFINVYNKINDIVISNNGKLILTHPVTFRNIKYDLNRLEDQLKIDNFLLKMNKNNIRIECNPALFNLSVKYNLNTEYHSNKFGAAIRSENLGNCVNDILRNEENSISYKEANNLTKKLEEKYDTFLKETN